MGSITEHKLHLIQQISVIDNSSDLESFLEKELEEIKAKKNGKAGKVAKATKASPTKKSKKLTYEDLEARALGKPIRKFDEEAMMKEQGWTGKHDKEGIMRLIKEMNVQEPIEELIALLTK